MSAERIPAAYEPVLADCVAALTAVAGAPLDGLYLYGSVATGRARPPRSDLDLLAVWTAPVPAAAAVAAELSARHAGLVREVGLAQALPADLAGPADGCFLRHYCVPLAGRDRRADLPRYRPSRALADAFNDLPATTARLAAAVGAADTPAELAAAATRTARRLLLAVATVESVSHAVWSTDRGTGAALLARHHPEWAEAAGRALAWSVRAPDPDRTDVEELLALADWLATHP